ncbi:MAG: hypothetical protein EPN22_03970 [Nitrospirae bacterium]|nr:MAG: hypothetical protein EPN22_03970 [Nitrospirota bacterium]
MNISDVTIYQAVAAGAISFISPCVPPLIFICSALVAGLSGVSDEQNAGGCRLSLLALVFLSGLVLIFTLTASPSSPGIWLSNYQAYLRGLGGGLTIMIGIFIIGVLASAPLLQKSSQLYNADAVVYPLVFLMGAGFASGWTPCIGHTLGKILISASIQGTAAYGFIMLIGYSAGLIIPFMILTALLTAGLNKVKKNKTLLKAIMAFSGALLIVGGLILITDNLRQLTPLFPDLVSY